MERFVGKVISPDGRGSQSFLELPADLVSRFGRGKKPPLKVTLKGVTYRTTVAAYGDQYLVPVRREIREAAGIVFDEPIEIGIELDTDERTVDVPSDLAAAFASEPELAQAFDRLAYTARKELVESLVSAKREQTRHKRLDQALDRLRQLRRA